MTFSKIGPGTHCGPEIYANDNQPAGFGSAPNVVSVCNSPGTSDFSENLYGMVRAASTQPYSQVCIDVRPDGPADAAVLRAYDASSQLLGGPCASPPRGSAP